MFTFIIGSIIIPLVIVISIDFLAVIATKIFESNN